MRNRYIELKDIEYTYEEPSIQLLDSISKRGIAIPVRVKQTDKGYVCVDGNKRLSACEKLSKQDSKYLRIPVMVVNTYSKAGVTIWGNTKNQH